MGRRERKDALFEQFARVGKALASPKRLELIDLLAQGERSVEVLAGAANLGVTSCSAHLQTLKAAHLVDTRKDGVKVYYRLAGPDVAALYGHLQQVAAAHLTDLPDRLADLPVDTEIVAYCRGAYCVLSHDAVRLLSAHGRTARRLAEGVLEWRLADLPLATTRTDRPGRPPSSRLCRRAVGQVVRQQPVDVLGRQGPVPQPPLSP
jgi:DNA-binding transcriptional ArsR family regulator